MTGPTPPAKSLDQPCLNPNFGSFYVSYLVNIDT